MHLHDEREWLTVTCTRLGRRMLNHWGCSWGQGFLFFIQPLKRQSFCLVGGNSRENMNALLGSSNVWDCPAHLGYGRPTAVAGISDRGDEKCREVHLALVCMQSHQLEVNHHEVTQRTTEDSGRLAVRHTSASKVSPNLTHNVGAQLPLVHRCPSLYPLTSSWFPPHPVTCLRAPTHRRSLSVRVTPCHS